MVTSTCVALTKVVGCAPPFNCATDCGKNPDPFTFNITGAAPACALAGVIEETEGIGKTTLKLSELDDSALGLVTEIEAETAVVNKDEGATALIVVLLETVAAKFVCVTPATFQVTVAFATKFVPVKVSVRSGDPAVAPLGEIE